MIIDTNNVYVLEENINNISQVVCFGTGKRVKRLEELIKDTDIDKKISYFVDNNSEKWNSQISLMGKVYTIYSPIRLNSIDENAVIIVTCADYIDVLEQLEKMEISCRVFLLSVLLSLSDSDCPMEKEIPDNLQILKEQMIPKIIHYCWFGGKPIPDQNKRWIDSWHKYCPDYQIIEWNEGNYDISKNRYMYEAYQRKKWGFVPDYARLDLIYNYGGIYLDTDVELIKNMDDLLYQRGFAGFESKNYVALGLGFGAVRHLPIIKKMMDDYENRVFINQDGSDSKIASPVLQTKVLEKEGLNKNGEYQIVKDLTIFPEKMFCGKNFITRLLELKAYTHSIHHYDASWVDDDKREKIERLERLLKRNN